jgi:hypothetical protein
MRMWPRERATLMTEELDLTKGTNATNTLVEREARG